MRVFAVVGLLLSLAAAGFAAQQPPAAPPASQPSAQPEDPAIEQSLIAARYRQLEDLLLRIAQKLERSGNPENSKKARVIHKALKEARDKAISVNLGQLAEALKKPGLAELKKAVEQGSAVKVDLEQLLLALLADEESNKDKMKQLADLIKELDAAIRTQKVANAKNQSQSVDGRDAAQAQQIAKLQTEKILQKIKEQQAKDKGDKNDGDAKGEPKGEPKAGDPKDGKKGDGKEGKPGDKKDQKEADGKKANGKKDQGKDGKEQDKNEGKPNESKDGKEGESKESQPKDGDPKQGEPKESKLQEGKDSKQDQKGPPQKGQQGQQGGEGQQQQQQQQKNQQQQQPNEVQEGEIPRQKIQDANDHQKKAAEKIQQDQRNEAGADQDEATRKLEEARKRLEEILRQMREEEIERVLADLQKRCEAMLLMQEVVYDNTKRLFGKIQSLPEHKATREEEIASRRLSESEDKILEEANKAIGVIEAEGSAVAFLETFRQVRGDMGHISRRLSRVNPGPETQIIEEDVIATLKDMIEALKKQQKEQRERKNQQQQQQQGQPPPQSLIDKLAELRMIKALQLRVNARTKLWAQRYQGEQANELEIVSELRDLAQRQLKIFQVTDNVAKGRNQ